MLIASRNVRIFYAVCAAWGVTSLLFTEKVSSSVLDADSPTCLTGTWIFLCLGPTLPALWLWIMERSPWTRSFLVPVTIIGGFTALAAFNNGGSRYYGNSSHDIGYIALVWTLTAYLNAWLSKGATQVGALRWQRTKTRSATSPVIDYNKYLRLLERQEVSSFANLMRVHRYFSNALPECIPAFHLTLNQSKIDEHFAHARNFIIGKISCELTFFCAISFLERMCGQDFRYSRQYRPLVNRIVDIDATSFDGLLNGLSRKAVTKSDLDTILNELDKQRARARAQNRRLELDSDLTVTLTALAIVIKSGVILPTPTDDDFKSKFTQMIREGMNKTRETFSRQTT